MYPDLTPQQEELLRRIMSYALSNAGDMTEAFEENISEESIRELADRLGVDI